MKRVTSCVAICCLTGIMLAGMLVLQPAGAQDIKPLVEAYSHPFLLFIADRTTGAVLFAGRVVDPR